MYKEVNYNSLLKIVSAVLFVTVLMSCSMEKRARLYGDHIDYKKFNKGLKKAVDKKAYVAKTMVEEITASELKPKKMETSAPAMNGSENYSGTIITPIPN
jgi:hypothetical protein